MQEKTVTVSDLSQYPIRTVVTVSFTYSVLEVEVVRVGELLRDGCVCGGVVEVPADVDGEDEREDVGVAVPDGRVQRGVAVLVLHRHLRRRWMCGRTGLSATVKTTTLYSTLCYFRNFSIIYIQGDHRSYVIVYISLIFRFELPQS